MSEIHGAVGAYVVNALDPDELEEFEAHLAVCPTCSREVVEFGETAAELSLLASAPPPPAALRGSILSAISEVRPLPPEPPAETAHAEPTGNGTQTITADLRHAVDELALRRQQRRTRVLSVLVAAVVAAAVALGGVVYTLVQSRQAQVAQQAAETELLTAPDVQTYSATMKDGGQISFVVSKSLEPRDSSSARTCQLSAPIGGISCGLSRVNGQSRTTWWPVAAIVRSSSARPSSGVTGLAVSVEAAGGAQQPTPSTIQTVTPLSS